jgi:putative endonuclease
MTEQPWHVYMVRCSDGSLYTGVAKDVNARVDRHNEGKGAKYTRSRRPVRLIYSELVEDRGAALKRELEIKSMSSVSKWQLVGITD